MEPLEQRRSDAKVVLDFGSISPQTVTSGMTTQGVVFTVIDKPRPGINVGDLGSLAPGGSVTYMMPFRTIGV